METPLHGSAVADNGVITFLLLSVVISIYGSYYLVQINPHKMDIGLTRFPEEKKLWVETTLSV